MITKEELAKHLMYDPGTGLFYRLSGEIAGTKTVTGGRRYHSIRVGGVRAMSHKLAFVAMGYDYPDCVDHINGDTFDNRWKNLRNSSASENNKNKAIDRRNRSGITGVHWSARDGKWKAQINSKGKRFHLGYFDSLELAQKARISAQIEHGFHANHGRQKC